MILRCCLLVIGLLALGYQASAQTLDPYRRINDPLAIADLGGADSGSNLVAFKTGTDTLEASDTGSGIIRSLWAVYSNGADPNTDTMELWVDDSLLVHGSVRDFFTLPHGLISAPFDTASSGAEVCEVQIPFRRNFRWTHHGEWHWSCAIWQHVDTSRTALPRLGSPELAADHLTATAKYGSSNRYKRISPTNFNLHVSPGDTAVVVNLSGPAYLEQIHLSVPAAKATLLDHLWINIYWDYSPSSSVSMLLSDLFGVSSGGKDIHSMFISVDTAAGSYNLTFPMPFKVNARIAVVNLSENPIDLSGAITHQDTAWCSSWGYLGAQFHVTPEIAYHIMQPVLHAKGKGRFVGALLDVPYPHAWPSYLEGDAYVVVDSLPYDFPGISTHYDGIEDYSNSGWYFFTPMDTLLSMVPFSLPFRGCPQWPTTVYRFHVNAPYNFSRSIDVDFGHGFYDDFTTTYRTVGFYYQQWTPFYPSSDTITAGNIWTITGSGFAPDTSIAAVLDSDTIYQGKAESDGRIAFKLVVPASWTIGDHTLAVNGILKPERITVLSLPKLLYIQDSAGRMFGESDSIQLRAYGFKSGEQLTLLLGDSVFKQTPHVVADSDGVVRLITHLPWVPQGRHSVKLLRSTGSSVISDSSLFVTRTINYEFEGLPQVEGNENSGYSYISIYGKHWSQGAIQFCYGNHELGRTVAFNFVVPYADTFSTEVFSTIGNRYGIYRTFIDSTDLGSHDWYLNMPWGIVFPDSTLLPNTYLTAGLHTIRFVSEGWDDSAVENSIAPDHFTLTPISRFGGYFQSVLPSVPTEEISIFPNPLDKESLSIAGLPDSLDRIPITVFDDLGSPVHRGILLSTSGPRTLTIPPLINGRYWIAIEMPAQTRLLPLVLLR
ncbi:MAG: DUF2961 domain-containing protein [Bacteroidota bacterium]|nr:DUF2961 domain-containing protein [Bacteroidota bacterium]MDP4244036.1 DUF2961 domain-containing protein [Bacteroidota bacterium]